MTEKKDEVPVSSQALLTMKEVAARTGLHLKSVYRLAERGQLRTVRVGNRTLRVPASALADLASGRDDQQEAGPVPGAEADVSQEQGAVPSRRRGPMQPVLKSDKLRSVCYDIRGPVLARAKQMEDEGQRVIKLNIGNPAAFGFRAPEEIVQDVIHNLPDASGYCDSKGLFAARKAIMHYTQTKGVRGVTIEDIYIGNGVSELISMTMNALLNNGDEVLIPAPDYPLWTAAVTLSGGTPRHYLCDESKGWIPDLADLRSKITSRTRALVVINPNNPTGVLYPDSVLRELVAIAREHGLIIYADEIYDKVLFDGLRHTAISTLTGDLLCLTFGGLSKNWRACGYRSGWCIVTGDKSQARDYIEGLDILASMRLCANVPGQHAIQTALGGYQSIDDLVAPGGRLTRQRDLAWEMLTAIPGVTCVKPQAAMYLFPRLDPEIYPIEDDEQFVLEFLSEEKVLVVQGTGFNWPSHDHLRVVFLPNPDDLTEAIGRFARFLEGYRQRHAGHRARKAAAGTEATAVA
ncbi:MAG TPA: aminotransferase class I/II-fold pyridoxal phosphate-dependent enzyme [Candidatus Binatia bacterium]